MDLQSGYLNIIGSCPAGICGFKDYLLHTLTAYRYALLLTQQTHAVCAEESSVRMFLCFFYLCNTPSCVCLCARGRAHVFPCPIFNEKATKEVNDSSEKHIVAQTLPEGASQTTD